MTRKPSSVPEHLKGIYWLLMAILVVAIIVAIWAITRLATTSGAAATVPPWLSLVFSFVLPPIAGFAILNDPARGGLDSQTVPGMIIRQVWVSQRPRPDFANK